MRKTSGGVTTSYLYDGDNLVMQLNASGQPVLEFSYYPGVDHPHAMRKSSTGAVYYYITSEPGSVTALVDQNKAVVNSYEYTPFGSAISVTEQVVQPFRFTAREFDSETGLYYYRARYYDPSLARFIAEDPIGLAGGVNPYAYAGDDPVNYIDPSGLEPCTAAQLQHGYISESNEGTVICIKPGGTLPAVEVTAKSSMFWSAFLFKLLNGAEITAGTLVNGYHISIAEVPGSLGGPRRSVGALSEAERAAARLTSSQARDLAKWLGYGKEAKSAPFGSMGQKVFTDGRYFISQDITMHQGVNATWKMYTRNGVRIGTFTFDLMQKLK